jgi:purine-nucleoside/S-methyl-5'-thioadenosine phosphorylase / adenosine deaminase
VILRWRAPGPYEVAFSTRKGGVSEGPFESLNLGRMTGDEPERVDENRRRLCVEVGADLDKLALNRQHHSATVHAAVRGSRGVPGDGLWSDTGGQPMAAMAADCLTIAIAKTNGERPALAVLHAGWRGLLEGIVEAGVAALGDGRLAAAIGPAIGPCCYEVGAEVADAFATRYGQGLMRGCNLDLWTASERALHRSGCVDVHRFDLCTACNPDLFFSERRTGKPRGTHGVIGLVTG